MVVIVPPTAPRAGEAAATVASGPPGGGALRRTRPRGKARICDRARKMRGHRRSSDQARAPQSVGWLLTARQVGSRRPDAGAAPAAPNPGTEEVEENMSTGWTAPGSTEGTAGHQPGPAGGTGGPAPHGNGAPAPQPVGGPASGPQRGLVQQVPLFPLRPLNVGEVLGAAVRIYRVRPKPVLGLAAAVYGIAFVLITLATGAGMIPLVGQMQATLEDPTGEAAEGLETVGGTTSQILATVSSTVVTMIITLVASALVTVVLTRITVGEATGDSVPDGRLWSLLRGQALPAVAVSLLMGVLGSVAFLLPLAVGALPLLVTQEAGWLTIIALLLGLLAGVLAALWVFARTALSLPALAIEGTGVLGSLHRSFQMTAGRKLWRVLGLMLLLVLIFYFAQQIVAGV